LKMLRFLVRERRDASATRGAFLLGESLGHVRPSDDTLGEAVQRITTPESASTPHARMTIVRAVRNDPILSPVALVPCIGTDCTCSGVSTKLCVIIHNFAHQLFNQLLADRTILTAGQFCHCLCNRCNHLIGIDRVWLAGCRGQPLRTAASAIAAGEATS
jgi:hypothetical protein